LKYNEYDEGKIYLRGHKWGKYLFVNSMVKILNLNKLSYWSYICIKRLANCKSKLIGYKKDRLSGMSVSEKVKCIDGRNKTLSIRGQCELLQLPHSSYYRPRSSLAEGPDNQVLMSLIDEEFLRHPFYGSRKRKDYWK